ncbi:MAG TPA: TerB family tellurite resistance protein [Cyclobacteriaceae bacterium]|nr:TerB family tellurite resistance protein [Cyclobacteriaceae bacterium]
MVIHDNFADFVLFLYIHMAYADGIYHPAEKEVIAERIPKLFPAEADIAGRLARAEKQYAAVDKSKIDEIIKDTFKHFSSIRFAQKYKVYTDMYDIIHADGKVEESETKALNQLKDIIEMGVVIKR